MKTYFYSNRIFTTLFLVVFLFPILLLAQTKSEFNQSKEIITDQLASSKVMGNQRVEEGTGIVRAVYSPNFDVNSGEPEDMAKQYLNAKALPLLLKPGIDDLEHKRTIETPGGYKVQFIQKAAGFPVYGSEIKVSINRNNKVVFVTNSYKPVGNLQTDINTTTETAVLTSQNHIGISGSISFEKVEIVVYAISTFKSVVAYKINLVPAEDHFGDWELIVDASNGTILRAEDRACYFHPDEDKVDVSAWVFDPDPITNAKTTYGASQFIDNNDADSDSLTAQLKTVTLRDITFDGSMYKLEGPNAVIVDFEAPFTGLYEQNSSNFHYTRSNEVFEAVNVYYNLDKGMRYFNETLGFDVMPFQYEGGVQFDPHGLDGVNDAHYLRASGQIAFGSSTNHVDSGEDHAIIIHELGHGLHDWITNGGISQEDGLSEGLSDYWAQSYTRSLGIYQPGDIEYDYNFVWGLQPLPYPYVRVTNFDGHYPEAMNGETHHDGQLWSSSLMSIYDLIGKEATDMDCWEGISMLIGSSSQVDAAYAFSQADKDLYNGEHLEDIYNVFYERGYLPGPVVSIFTAEETNGEGPREVVFTDASITFFEELISWEWDFNNDGVIDSYDQNPTYTFTEVGAYTISLTVSDGEFTETLVKENYITVNGGFFIFEGGENLQDYSGAFIRDYLEARGYDVIYSNYYPSSLAGFDAVFLSFGNIDENQVQGTYLKYSHTVPIQNYLEEGGRLYTDGSPFLAVPAYFGFPNANEFAGLFGADNMIPTLSENPISQLTGSETTFCEGMIFSSSDQQYNWYIDNIIPAEGAMIAFNEEGYGNVSIYNEGEYGQKTFHFAYSLAELVDEDPHSSRYNILLNVLEFFGYPEGEGYVVANFTADQTEVEPDDQIQFTDWSLVDEGYEITGWAWDFNDDGEFDSFDQNPVWTYTEGGIFDIKLVVYGDEGSDTLVKKDFVTVRSGILVYEGYENENGYSGTFIRDYLEDQWYDEVSYTNNFPGSLAGYDVVFLSFGSSGLRSTELTNTNASSIYNFCLSGGSVYLEGGDAMKAITFTVLFGLEDVEDGETNTIDELIGQEGAITDGLIFNSTNQISYKSIDIYTILENDPAAKVAFIENDYGPVAAQYDGTPEIGQKTFCMSYALADLVDGENQNTRDELIDRILNFFDIEVGVEEPGIELSLDRLKVYPNPAKDVVNIKSDNLMKYVTMYNQTGQKVFDMELRSNLYRLNTSGFKSGIYHLLIKTDEGAVSKRIVIN